MAAQVQLDPSRQTREKILTSASRLFFDQGYEGTALSQVAREAHVSKALILWHFDSKEKLFRAALGRTLEPYFIDVNDLEGLDEAAQLERLIDLFYEFVRDNAYSIRLFLRLMLHRERQPDDVLARVSELHELFRRVLVDVIQRGQMSGLFRSSLDPLSEASLILATLQGILVECCLQGALPQEPAPLLGHLKRATLARLIEGGPGNIDEIVAGLPRHTRGAP